MTIASWPEVRVRPFSRRRDGQLTCATVRWSRRTDRSRSTCKMSWRRTTGGPPTPLWRLREVSSWALCPGPIAPQIPASKICACSQQLRSSRWSKYAENWVLGTRPEDDTSGVAITSSFHGCPAHDQAAADPYNGPGRTLRPPLVADTLGLNCRAGTWLFGRGGRGSKRGGPGARNARR